MPAQHPDTGLVSDVPTCVRWDARLSLGPYRGTTVLLSAENLLDARCETAPGYPEPGRVIWAGLAFRYR
jgi:outer membrane receptor protein involved in Fe transport